MNIATIKVAIFFLILCYISFELEYYAFYQYDQDRKGQGCCNHQADYPNALYQQISAPAGCKMALYIHVVADNKYIDYKAEK